jgi:hypothetical protein
MKFDISTDDYVRILEESYNKILQECNSRVRKRGFIPYARPSLPNVLRPLMECWWEGRRVRLDDPEVKDMPGEDLELLPPADISTLSVEQVGYLIQYLTAETSYLSRELSDLMYEKDVAKRKYGKVVGNIINDLRKQIDPATQKLYTEKSRKEYAELDATALHYEEVAFMAESIYHKAQSVFKSKQEVVEALNRNRMAKTEEKRRTFGRPEHENEYSVGAEERAKRWRGTR